MNVNAFSYPFLFFSLKLSSLGLFSRFPLQIGLISLNISRDHFLQEPQPSQAIFLVLRSEDDFSESSVKEARVDHVSGGCSGLEHDLDSPEDLLDTFFNIESSGHG